jgi:hypothetical protein
MVRIWSHAMFFLAGAAASTALDYLSSLSKLGQGSSQPASNGKAGPFALGNTPTTASSPTVGSSPAPSGIAANTMHTLIAAQSQAPTSSSGGSTALLGSSAINNLTQRQAYAPPPLGQSVSMNV